MSKPKSPIKLLPFHPLAEIFPLVEGKEFDDFVEDIRQHTQRQEIDIWNEQIIDGRTRALACRKLGIEPKYHTCRFKDGAGARAYVISQNFTRRHLTPEQKHDLIIKFADWSKSDRAIAAEMKTNKNTVGRLRKKATGPTGTVGKRVGKDGRTRSQPTTRSRSMPAKGVTLPPAESAKVAVEPVQLKNNVSPNSAVRWVPEVPTPSEKLTSGLPTGLAEAENSNKQAVVAEPQTQPTPHGKWQSSICGKVNNAASLVNTWKREFQTWDGQVAGNLVKLTLLGEIALQVAAAWDDLGKLLLRPKPAQSESLNTQAKPAV
jgi:hypothetical protein